MRVNISNIRILAGAVLCAVVLAMSPVVRQAFPYESTALAAQDQPPAEQPQPAHLTPQQLQDLVAPIALYPDALVAQILAASAYPTQIVEAERFLQGNPNLTGAALGAEVDKQDWDPSVKALTQFPTVLAHMDQNLSWTSTLGDANLNQPADVMDAIQFLRKKAEEAGNLKTTPQQTVTNQDNNVIIQPANPEIVYVPEYNPEVIYGYPLVLWPGFYPWWGPGPYISFGIGFGIEPFFGFGWGWPVWGFDWFHRRFFYHGAPYVYRSHAFYDRNAYFRGTYRGYAPPYARGDRTLRGFSPPAGRPVAPTVRPGTRSGAFGGIARGGDTRTFSSRGRSSMGGGARGGVGGARGGGGGGHAGGGGGHR
jgi:uncharacterized membrane protein YgcG